MLERPDHLKFSPEGQTGSHHCDHFCWRNESLHLSNVSSVEDALEDIIRGSVKSPKKTEATPESKSKSPKYNLPKFLRSSFSRLISKDKSKSGSLTGEPVSLPFFSSVSIPSLSSPHTSPSQTESLDEVSLRLTISPATQQFVEESLAKGFPLIPFQYTSYDIVEKCRAQQRIKDQPEDLSSPEIECSSQRGRRRGEEEYEECMDRLEDELEAGRGTIAIIKYYF